MLYFRDIVCKRLLKSFDNLYLICLSTLYSEGINVKRLQECKHERAVVGLEHSQHPSNLVSSFLNYISNKKSGSGCVAHHCDLISDLFFAVNV